MRIRHLGLLAAPLFITQCQPACGPTAAPAPAMTPSCDPNYTGCVPIDSDVDCAGGSGNGPSYTGYTRVIGADIYGLDGDGDGEACE